jgi:hypothetical protein
VDYRIKMRKIVRVIGREVRGVDQLEQKRVRFQRNRQNKPTARIVTFLDNTEGASQEEGLFMLIIGG